MKIVTLTTAAVLTAALTGCYTYPVYQPVPIARLSPEQSAALAQQQPLTQADRDRIASDNAQVARDDAANSYAQATTSPYGYVTPAAPVYYESPFYGGYPYYGGYYGGFYPGVSLSLGFGGYYGRGYGGYYRGGYGGYRGGYGHYGGYRGGYGGGGFHGGGGGFHGGGHR